MSTHLSPDPYPASLTIIRQAPSAPDRATALLAFSDWARSETDAGRPVFASHWALWAEVCRAAFEPNGLRAGRGQVQAFYSDLGKRAGLGRTATAAAMRRFRRAGLLEGEPDKPDPTNDWYRERAVYRVTIPDVCKQVLARLAHRARRLLAEAATRAAGAVDRAVVTPKQVARELVTAPLGPVDGPRGLPPDYLEAPRRLGGGR